MKKLYLIWQNEVIGYDTYDSAVVCAASEKEAKKVHPSIHEQDRWWENGRSMDNWAPFLEHINVVYLGEANEKVDFGVVCASFNAG